MSKFTPEDGLLCGIAHPIVQAPMAQASTVELAVSVSRAGGLGSIAAGMLTPEQMRAAIHQLRRSTDRPFNVNLFAMRIGAPDPTKLSRLRELVAELEAETGADQFNYSPPPPPPSFGDQLAVVVQERVPIFSVTFGLPDAERLELVRESGALMVGTATTVDEARKLAAAGFNAIVAQGAEAGGHRGTFRQPTDVVAVPTLDLVTGCASALAIPVIASGGIMNGRDIVAALDRGAAAVQMGTAFLCCPETQLLPAWRDAILAGRDTVLTRTLTGKQARAIRNRLVDFMENHERDLPEFPHIAVATGRLRAWATAKLEAEYLPLLAGAGTKSVRAMPAAELMATLVSEIAEVRASEP